MESVTFETKTVFEKELKRLMATLGVNVKPKYFLISKASEAKKFGVNPAILAEAEEGAVVPLKEFGRKGYLVLIQNPDPYVIVAEVAHVLNYDISRRLKTEHGLRLGETFDRLEQFKLALRKKDAQKIESLKKQFSKSYSFVRYPKAEVWDHSLTPITHIMGEALAFVAISSGFNTQESISALELALSKKISGRTASCLDTMKLVQRWGRKKQGFFLQPARKPKRKSTIRV